MVCGGPGLRSTHSMFADDTTLFASSRQTLKEMIKDVREGFGRHGLNLNLDKCIIQTNVNTRSLTLAVGTESIPITPAAVGFKALGTQFTLSGRTSVEVKARIRAAWAKFHSLWPILGKRESSLTKRLRLFDATVTQTVLWCTESWLLTKAEKRWLQSVQNNMLRRIAGPRRRPDETWVEWIKRATRAARSVAKDVPIRFWSEAHLRSKWRWAGHVMRMHEDRLARRSVVWRDSAWQADENRMPESLRMRRSRSTRWFRWEDELRHFAQTLGEAPWQELARDRDQWQSLADDFIKYAS